MRRTDVPTLERKLEFFSTARPCQQLNSQIATQNIKLDINCQYLLREVSDLVF